MANASQIINDDMTLEEKLAAIDQAMQNAQEMAQQKADESGSGAIVAPLDPADLTMCMGCQQAKSMPGRFESSFAGTDRVQDLTDVMGACSDRAYVTARLGEQGLLMAVQSVRSEECDHESTFVAAQVEQPMLPIVLNQ